MGGTEQWNLMSFYGTGNLDSLDNLPAKVQLTFRDKARKPWFYCTPEYYALEDPPVKYIDPEVGVWHTVKISLVGRTISSEFDGKVIHDRFEYPDLGHAIEPRELILQKHHPLVMKDVYYEDMPIEFRHVFIKEIASGSDGAREARGIRSAGSGSSVERRGPIWGIGFNMHQAQLHIYAPGRDEEIIQTQSALFSFEDDGSTILTLDDRKLQFPPGQGLQAATEEASIASVEFSNGRESTLHLSNGRKETYAAAFIIVAPARDVVTVREYRGSRTPLWEKSYKRQ